MADRFLMCRPEHFDVSYVINPWMADNVRRVNRLQANAQWDLLLRLMRDGADVELIQPEPNLPDMPFTANAGLVVAATVLLSNFRFAERQTEEKYFERWFRSHGFRVCKLPREISFEGAGDALLDRHRACIWMGYGHRSDHAAAAHIEALFGLETIPLRLTDPRFYHLDTCFCPLPGGSVMYYLDAFTPESQALLRARIPASHTILVEEEDALLFACNAVSMGSQVIFNGASDRLCSHLSNAGLQAKQAPLSEFLRAGGASKCLTLRLEAPL